MFNGAHDAKCEESDLYYKKPTVRAKTLKN